MVAELEASMVERLYLPMGRKMRATQRVWSAESEADKMKEFDLECSKDGTSKGPDGLRVGSIDGRLIRTTDGP